MEVTTETAIISSENKCILPLYGARQKLEREREKERERERERKKERCMPCQLIQNK